MKKWVVIAISSVFSVLVLGVAGYGVYIYQSVKMTANRIYEERDAGVQPIAVSNISKDNPSRTESAQPQEKSEAPKASIDQRKPFSVLVLGVDERPEDRGRSDAMIFLTVNPAKKSILMFNIPRDTRTDIIGHGTVDKINHAYAFGGVNMSVQTVEHFLGEPVNYYIKVNMEGFSEMIDALGGVDVNNPFAFDYEGFTFAKGTLHLDGTEALAFSRMRYDDPRGDLGRNSRQREILKQVIQEALKISNIVNIQTLLDQVGESVKTDISFDEMKTFIADYRPDLDQIEQVEIQGTGKRINGIWYYIVPKQEQQRIRDLIQEHLQN